MAAVRLVLPSSPDVPPLGAHRKATIASSWLQVTFPYLRLDGDLSELGRNWVEQGRPGNHKPLTRPGSPRLAKGTLTAVFADPADSQRSMEDTLGPVNVLRSMALGSEPVVVAFGDLMAAVPRSGYWVIRDLSVAPKARNHTANQITWAEVTIGLLEANVPGGAPAVTTDRRDHSIPGAGLGVPHTDTVAEGDRLWTVAWRTYGDPSRWRAIGDANGVTDPRKLEAGQVLTLP
jgi:nucleoid-associated protein YgaU